MVRWVRIDRTGGLAVAALFLGGAVGCGSSAGSESSAGRGGSAGKGGTGSGGSAGDATRGGSAGDSVGGDGGSGGGSGPSVDEFCARFVDAFAGYMESCSCDATAVVNYRTAATEAFCGPDKFLGSLPAAVAAGDFTYDAAAAGRLLDRLRIPNPSCVKETFLVLGLDSVELYSLAGTFVGTRALGDGCSHPVGYKGGISDCREGVCAPNDAGGGVCVAFVGLGEECDASGNEHFDSSAPRLCHETRPGDQDGEYETSFDRLVCLPSPSDPSVRTCQSELADGEPCTTSYVCHSGFCAFADVSADAGVCAPKRSNGEPCEASDDCASGACHDGASRVCGPLLADGEPCLYSNGACTSGRCNDLVDPVVCGPAPGRAAGDTCSASAECLSDSPAGPFEQSCHDGRCIHDICSAFVE